MKNLEMIAGSLHSGFKLLNLYKLDEYRSLGLEFEHERTGLKLFHISNNDEENTFSFSFNTPVNSSNGVPHIIEHSVLSGSEKYDLKDPFQSMMTGSVNTFLNAYTFPDKTSYPASSVLEKDFFNLMSVYGDAVFFPRLTEETFLQEGWRYCVDDKENLTYSGVVYNEMQGVYSSHESIVADMSVKVLFPGGVYSQDSGGNPADIPSLTYKEFKEFHEKWYRPSNCYLYLYGNIETAKTLEFIDNHILKNISENKTIEIPNGITLNHDVWKVPRSFHEYTAVSVEKSNSSDLLISWKLFDMDNPEDALGLEILNRILLGSSASPLYKVLMENDLWDDLSSASGMENELCNFVYTVGVRGASPRVIDKFKDVVFSELKNLVDHGINRDLIEGALRGIEFKNREIQGSLGLRLMRKVIRGWLHGYSPVKTLDFEKWMLVIRDKNKREGYFENLINKYFLLNNHRADIIVEPSMKESLRLKEQTKIKLEKIKKSLSFNDIEAIKKRNAELTFYQDTPDSKEAIAKLPRLTKSDIPNTITKIDTIKDKLEGYDYYKTNLYTNGIVYFGIGFNMEYVDKYFFDYMFIFIRFFTQCGFSDTPYDEVSKRSSLYLGGLGVSIDTSNTLNNGKPSHYIENLYLRGKVLEQSLEEGLDFVGDLLSKIDFHDYKRLKSVITELRNDLKASLVSNGTSYAALRSSRKYSLSSCREESWYGVSQAQFLENLVSGFDTEENIKEVSIILDAIKKELITKKGLFFHSSSDIKYQKRLDESFIKIINVLPEGNSFLHPVEHYDLNNNVEGLVGNSQVSYTGLTIKGAFLGSVDYATQSILCYVLKTGYLWENVRMKGGAYGVFVSPSGLDGSITFGSYRDPNIKRTLEHFEHSLEWIASGNITQDEIDLALISVIGKELKPLAPFEKSIIGMKRKIIGITDKVREEKRLFLQSVTTKDLQDFAAVLLHYFSDNSSVILSSEGELTKASAEISGLSENLLLLPT